MRQRQCEVFSVRDLRTRTSAMVRDAEEGRVSVITKHGKPTALAVPFDRRLLELGIATDLALVLFENGLISLKKAAKLTGMPLDDFMDVLAGAGVAAVDSPPEELDAEMDVAI